MPMRSFVDGKSIMPKIANTVSGKTSDVRAPARVAAVSTGEPGVDAPLGVKASGPTPPKRSAIVSTPRMPISTMAPCRKRAGPSMASAKSERLVAPSDTPIVSPRLLLAQMIDTAEASSPTTATVTWME